jgi:hypothetical protein
LIARIQSPAISAPAQNARLLIMTLGPCPRLSLLDRDYVHAEAVALADVIFDRPKTVLFQERKKPLAGKIVVVLDLAPIGIDAIGVQQPHNWVVISPSADCRPSGATPTFPSLS